MNPYKSLAKTIAIHFVIMYLLTYAAVNSFSDISIFSTRSFYMATLMVAPMIVLMIWFMPNMYTDKNLNLKLYAGSILVFVLSFVFIQKQILVDDTQFLKSMIPHHSSAITMCEEANITDPEIIKLCEEIISAQKEEINQMKTLLNK